MKLQPLAQQIIQRVRSHPRVSIAAGVVVLVLVMALSFRSGSVTKEVSYFEVQRGDFLISVVEGGTVEAVNEVIVRSEVEGIARIIFIVAEGSYVKKGDLLVELDSSSSLDSVNQQQINVEKAQFFLIQSEQQLEIQKSTVESEIAAAKLRVEFAQSDLDKHLKGEAVQTRRDAQIAITNVVEDLGINQQRLDWTEKLYKQGYETKANLDKDRLAVSQSSLRLEQAEKSLWMLETFDQPKKRRSLEAALQEATENFDRVKLQGERKLAQFQADVQSQRKTLELSQAKLDRDKKQLAATKIYAPQDGLVVYASGGGGGGRWSSESMIEEGAVVRNRQEIIKLPDVSEMKLQVRIHESHINQIHHGLSAYVVLDSMPDQRYHGVITKVAPLPDSQSRWGNPNLKVYATEIRIADHLPDVKPGVSARAEIIVTNLASVLTVPIQAVTTLHGQQMAYVADDPPRPVQVGVGMYNEKFIEITSGLKEGDRVLLAPPFDTQEKDLGGAILARGETVSASDTNQVARVLARTPEVGEHESGAKVLAGDAITNAPEVNGVAGQRARFVEEAAPGERHLRGDADSGGKSPSREELLKRFDKNNDGQLDESERATMRIQLGNRIGRGTNAPLPEISRKPTDS
jgi:HlyD family secretion protein